MSLVGVFYVLLCVCDVPDMSPDDSVAGRRYAPSAPHQCALRCRALRRYAREPPPTPLPGRLSTSRPLLVCPLARPLLAVPLADVKARLYTCAVPIGRIIKDNAHTIPKDQPLRQISLETNAGAAAG